MKIAILHMTMGLVDRGSEISTHLLAAELGKDHEVTVFQSGKNPVAPYHVVRVLPLSAAPPSAPHSLWEKLLFRLHHDTSSRLVRRFTKLCYLKLTKLAPDIIVAVNGADQVRLLRGFSSKYKIVVFGRAGIGHDDLANLRAEPDLFIALSKKAREWAAEEKRAATKLAYIPNPVDVKGYRAKAYPHHLPSPVILVVGALTSYKNIPVAVAAASALSASLLLVGDGEESDNVASILSSYPTDFCWLKHVDPIDMPSIYKSADVFCFVPDPQEAFGRVYLEAMAAGLPIVASDDPIRRNLIGTQGFFADPSDVGSVTRQLSAALASRRVNYKDELMPYQLSTVVKQIEEEFYDLTKS